MITIDHTSPASSAASSGAIPPSQTNGHVEFTIARATGPRTANGKEIVAQNALKHGIFSSRPVIRGAETEEEWHTYRSAIVDSLAPATAIQLALAERAAEYLWRLRRVSRYEAEVAAHKIDLAEYDAAPGPPGQRHGVASLRDDVASKQATLDRLRRLPALPDDTPIPNDDAFEIVGLGIDAVECAVEEEFAVPGERGGVHFLSFYDWTARHVRASLASLAKLSTGEEHSWPDGNALLADLIADAQAGVHAAESRVAAAEREADRLRRRRAYPSSKTVERAHRAEAHLFRQLTTTLHELEALQDRRAGLPAPLARVDLNGQTLEITKQTP